MAFEPRREPPLRDDAPRVSVVIPTYNRATVLPRALASVLAQSFTDFEVIVVVDGSTDETTDLLRGIDDPRVRWVEQPNAGLSAARNVGIASTTGAWVAFLDDDNEWHPTYLEHQLATAARTGAPVVYSQTLDVGGAEARVLPRALPEGDVFDAMARCWYPYITAVMVRREVLADARWFSTALPAREDADFLMRLSLRVPFGVTPEPLITRHRPDGVRLSTHTEARRTAAIVLDRTFGPVIRARLGHRVYVGWFRWNLGESEIQWMYARASEDGRRAAWTATRGLAAHLPWSASSIWRPVVLLVVGSRLYDRARVLYDDAHRALTHGR